jgi:hypothetical protein
MMNKSLLVGLAALYGASACMIDGKGGDIFPQSFYDDQKESYMQYYNQCQYLGINPHGDYNPWESVKISPFAYQEYIFGENPYETRWRAPARKGCYNYGSGYRQAHNQYRRYVNRGNPKNTPYYGGAYAPYVEGPFGYGYQDYRNEANYYNYQPKSYSAPSASGYRSAAPSYRSAPAPSYRSAPYSAPTPSYNAYQ